jgi:hypothetical protein
MNIILLTLRNLLPYRKDFDYWFFIAVGARRRAPEAITILIYEYNHINIQKLASTTRASLDQIFLTMVKTGLRRRLLQEGKTMFFTPFSLTLKLYCTFNDTLK